jgi:hypothetical protein
MANRHDPDSQFIDKEGLRHDPTTDMWRPESTCRIPGYLATLFTEARKAELDNFFLILSTVRCRFYEDEVIGGGSAHTQDRYNDLGYMEDVPDAHIVFPRDAPPDTTPGARADINNYLRFHKVDGELTLEEAITVLEELRDDVHRDENMSVAELRYGWSDLYYAGMVWIKDQKSAFSEELQSVAAYALGYTEAAGNFARRADDSIIPPANWRAVGASESEASTVDEDESETAEWNINAIF